uniref:NADH-ubiquinone oxidoreductase chain 2 n=1 Tax=Bostrichoidea sp. 3 KM-2017 TaxID=2219277 RepID=A0A346RH78_9COLE|nr:NADH dehydrogenase subunit 2 [Bostrichoidea sp. 3 KM-2017]
MKNLYKLTFYLTMLTGTMITISSNSWISMWMGLEINLLSIIPLLSNTKNKFESEAAMKYFIVQALASTVFLMSIIMKLSDIEMLNSSNVTSLIMDSAILTKMGAAPFHFWFPEIMEGLSWINSTIMLTWQKIGPMIIFMYSPKSMIFTFFVIISSMTISGIMGINQTSMRKIMAYSSINHIGWMIGALLCNQTVWTIYLFIYTLMTININMMLKKLNIFSTKQMTNMMNQSKNMKLLFSMNFLSLGGIPPFVGFIPKWLTINSMIQSNMIFMSILMIILTLLTLFFYMRISFSSIMMTMTEKKKTMSNPMKLKMLFTNFIVLSSLSLCSMTMIFI